MHQRLKMLTTVAMAGTSTDGILLWFRHRSEVLTGSLNPHKPPRGHPCPGHLTEGEREALLPGPGEPEGTALSTPCQESNSNKLHTTKEPPAAPTNAFLGQHCTRRVSRKLPGGMWFRQAQEGPSHNVVPLQIHPRCGLCSAPYLGESKLND